MRKRYTHTKRATYGDAHRSILYRILVLPTTNDDTENELAIDERRYLVYITDDKVILNVHVF